MCEWLKHVFIYKDSNFFYLKQACYLYTNRCWKLANLNKTSTTIKIQVQILNLPISTKCIMKVILLCFFMNSSNQNDPSFNSCKMTLVKKGTKILDWQVCAIILYAPIITKFKNGSYSFEKKFRSKELQLN